MKKIVIALLGWLLFTAIFYELVCLALDMWVYEIENCFGV